MKTEDKKIFATITTLTYGVEDFIKMGDVDWKYNAIAMLADIRNEILKHQQDSEKTVEEKIKYLPKEGTPEERLYSYFCRQFKAIEIEKLYLSDKEIQDIVENTIGEEENSALKIYFYTYFHSGFRAMEEAFQKIIPPRREAYKQGKLF